jgi:hypothetical protein
VEHGEALQRLCRCEHIPHPVQSLSAAVHPSLSTNLPPEYNFVHISIYTDTHRPAPICQTPAPLTLDPLLAQLDEALDELYKGEEDVQLPEFPEKKLFGSLSPALIKERQAGLEKYMKAIALDEHVMQARVLREFLETPDTKA